MNECWILLLWSLRFLNFCSFLCSSVVFSVAQYRTFLLFAFQVHWLFYSVTSTSAVEPMKQFFVVFIAAIFFSSIISMWFFLIFFSETFYFFAEIFNLFMFQVCLQLLTEVFIWWQLLIICIANISAAARSLQSCPILWDPRDSSPSGSAIPGILQARTLSSQYWELFTVSIHSSWDYFPSWYDKVTFYWNLDILSGIQDCGSYLNPLF